MNIFIWIITGLVALAFLAAGSMKLTQPKEKLAPQMPWVNDFPQGTVRTIGLLEVLGALGLILPRALNVLPWLSTAAAAGLILTMIGAAAVHVRRKEPVVPAVVLGVLSAAALWATTQG
ncbi:DoxX family protein [Deinococcus knuensis]|uniref:DoxX family protein n=1 Tax=Deinococcus knuensis TaxID=1837380 RepID=A0ABQ2SNM8_9DEIO|nr:DoxX family protein [Deinococcus knuensis]GGS35568.1 hypothetical protein GCM10008961_29100 [Deinococcus knuensis]